MPLIKYNNQSLSSITALPSGVPSGKLKLISSQTASNSASISFTSGLNSTYKVYKFVFVDILPTVDGVAFFSFNLSTDGGSNYNVTKTSTNFTSAHNEADTDTTLSYRTNADLAQSTGFQRLSGYTEASTGSDESMVGTLMLFNPASTTYVKHFIANTQVYGDANYSTASFIAGYGNTTSAVNAVQFKFESGNISAGKIYLYAIDNS